MSQSTATSERATDELIGRITDEFLERIARGEQPAVEDYARNYPEIAAVIRDVFPALQLLHRSTADVPLPDDWASRQGPRCLGDFRLLREIGRGGMGVVYEAEQVSLGRRVALKVLPVGATIDPRQLQRFQLEAQAAARLHHTNIVPIHAVGFENGIPFYAMQYIEGGSLAELIGELRRLDGVDSVNGRKPSLIDPEMSTFAACLATGIFPQPADYPMNRGSGVDRPGIPAETGAPSRSTGQAPLGARFHRTPSGSSASLHRDREYIRAVARLGVQVAEALDHSHSRGILHRDIKPANLLLDAQGQLWVTDFGLAQIQGSPGVTASGDLPGTLRYMSPEQALGLRIIVDGRTDIYSLGVTLYELFTLRPAVDGEDRATVLRNIAECEPAPLRQMNPSVPRDLETVLLKAMAKEPSARYATAKDLSDDLRRFLEYRPVKARRPSAFDRAAKWARRYKTAVVAVTSSLIAVLTILAATLGWIVRDRTAREEVMDREILTALNEASALQAKAKWPEAFEATRRAEGFLASGGSEFVRTRHREFRKDLIMVQRLEEIRHPQDLGGPEGSRDNRWMDATYAVAFSEFGNDVESLDLVETVRRLRERTIRVELALALDHWAHIRRRLRKADHAGRTRLIALAQASDPDPWRNRVRSALEARDAHALSEIASAPNVTDLPVQMLSLLCEELTGEFGSESGVVVLRQAQRQHPDDFWINFQLAWAMDHRDRPKLEEAVRFYTVALALRPHNAATRCFLAHDLQQLGRLGEAIAEYQKAIDCKPDSAWACNHLAWILATAPDDKLRDPRQAASLAKKAVELDRKSGPAWITLGLARYRIGEWNAAIAALEQSAKLRGRDSFDWFFLAMAREQLGEHEEARRLYEQAVTWMVKNKPVDEELRRFEAEARAILEVRAPVPR
jgi:serine/threonine protein kinase/Flp pilus assembly protein TadD